MDFIPVGFVYVVVVCVLDVVLEFGVVDVIRDNVLRQIATWYISVIVIPQNWVGAMFTRLVKVPREPQEFPWA
jgi:glutaredoxin-related protein